MTDRTVHVVARLVPRPGKAEELATALLDMLEEVRGAGLPALRRA